MTQNINTEQCKRRAKQIKSDYPELSFCQRLDVAAKELGFRSYQHLVRSEEARND